MKYSTYGFSLLELICALCIFSILATIAIPKLKAYNLANRLKSDARDLKNMFTRCQMEAIRLNQSVTLVFNKDRYDYFVFVDKNDSCEFDIKSETILWKNNFSQAHFDASKSDGDGLTFINNDNGLPCLRWDSRGLPHRNGEGFGAGTAYICNGTTRYCVIISKNGHIRLSTY